MRKYIYYRPDIDGLRAIAVLSVIIFHSNRETLSGGYLGVDVFFVISGYLITTIIRNEIEEKRFSLYSFYDRRIRRIFPALFFFLLVVTILSFFTLFPYDLYNYSGSLTSTLLFFSNLFFLNNHTGYFGVNADLNPLLHTWSLSVEEQYYLLFPLFLILIFRFFIERVLFLIIIAFILSLAINIWGEISHHPRGIFYLLPTRAWEFLLGALISLSPKVRTSELYKNLLFTVGGGGLIFVFYYLDSTKNITPVTNEIVACLGASFIIYSNHKCKEVNYTSRILSLKPIVFLGLISYSLYLWHWVVIIYYKYNKLEYPELSYVLFISIIISIFSWKYIEQPFRKKTVKLLYPSLFIIFIILLLFSFYIKKHDGIPERFSNELSYIKAKNFINLKNPLRKECFNKSAINSCQIGNKEQKNITFVLMGDSHADTFFSIIDLQAIKYKKKGVFFGIAGCNPIQGMFRKIINHSCEEYKQDYYKEIYKNKNIKLVILSARWASYLYGGTYDLGSAEPYKSPEKYNLRLVTEPNRILSVRERENYFSLKIRKTVNDLVKSGKEVVIISSVPEVGYDVPRYLALRSLSKINNELINNKQYFFYRQKSLLNIFSELSRIEGVEVVYPHKKLCSNDQTFCTYQINNKPLYYDDDHLSIEGAKYIDPSVFSD